jgi:VWFA-related protein
MKNYFAGIVVLVAILSGTVAYSLGQVIPIEEDTTPIKVDTSLVSIPLVVSDAAGRSVHGLTKKDFTVVSNGVRLDVDFFADVEQSLTIGIVFGTGGCSITNLDSFKNAATLFVDRLRGRDKVLVLTWDASVRVATEITDDKEQIKDAIRRSELLINREVFQSGFRNRDLALVRIPTTEFRGVLGRKAVVLLSNDCITESRPRQLEEILAAYEDVDVPVYTIVFRNRPEVLDYFLKRWGHSDLRKDFRRKKYKLTLPDLVKIPAVNDLKVLAKATGGNLYAADETDLNVAFEQIADELRKQYVIGFHVDGGGDVALQDISVTVNRPGLTVRTKQNVKIKPQAPIEK